MRTHTKYSDLDVVFRTRSIVAPSTYFSTKVGLSDLHGSLVAFQVVIVVSEAAAFVWFSEIAFGHGC